MLMYVLTEYRPTEKINFTDNIIQIFQSPNTFFPIKSAKNAKKSAIMAKSAL